ncbi:MAG: hypothetical protein HY329_24695 [Chloroflexi bacterium]|nr:hypothetical protein [Chloroflexota bacterium]
MSNQPRIQPVKKADAPPEIKMIEESEASEEPKRLYADIKEALGLPVVNSDYKAMAKWPAFFRPAWEDVKRWRERDEYRRLQQTLAGMADEAATRLAPAGRLEERELRDALGGDSDWENLQKMVPMFTALLPGLIVNDALLRAGVAGRGPVAAPRPEGAPAPA